MSRARSVADLGNQNVLSVSAIDGNINVGTGVTIENTGEAQFSGIVTAPSIDTNNLIGNVSIQGELTYEDVTNVDSVGVITARKGLVVGAGATIVGLSTFTKVAIGGTAISSDPTLNRALLHVYSDLQATSANQDGISVGPLPHGAGAHHLALTYNRANDTGMLSVTTGRLGLTATQGVGLGNNVGIGTTRSPGSERLHVVGDSKFVGIVTSNSLDLEAINKDITDSAVDVFVYDTSKDSDGGAWRKRTKHTSWYNEEAAAGVRGSRKEFPAVAVIVAEAAKVTIYDGDDPDLPMWMVFNHSGAGIKATTAKNGVLYWGCSSASSDRTVYFIKDSYYRWWTTSAFTGYFNEPISGRNGTLTGGTGDTQVLVNGETNNVAMTVLPNAPIDDTTGLPIPTIAVATDGGVSVIRDNGNVADITQNSPYTQSHNVFFSDYGKILYDNEDTQVVYEVDIPSGDIGYGVYNSTSNGRVIYPVGDHGGFSGGEIRLLGKNISNGGRLITKGAFAVDENGGTESNFGPVGLSLFDRAESDPARQSLVAYVASDYNTGWMHGDCKGAFLSDTTVETFSPTNLVTEDFSANWTGASNGVLSVSNNRLTITNSGGPNGRAQSNTFATTSGKKYAFIVRGIAQTGGATFRSEVRGPELISQGSSTGSYVIYFNGTGNSTTFVELYAIGNDGASVTYEDAYVVEIEEDRSVNRKGLQVFGSITKSAVAGTGLNVAELVAYGPFSDNNYLQQPYNSDLNFGTGAFSVAFWIKSATHSAYSRILNRVTDTNNNRLEFYSDSGTNIAFYTRDGSAATSVSMPDNTLTLDKWDCVVATRQATGRMSLYINGVLGTTSAAPNIRDLTSSSATLLIGNAADWDPGNSFPGQLSLIRFSSSVPSPEQIKKMYEDEKVLFQENANATLYGSSDEVKALGYDEDTELLHVGTSAGRSEFQGLRRINNTTDPVTAAISASNDLVAEK